MNNVISVLLLGALLIVALAASVAGWEGEIWIHPQAEKLPTDQAGPFVGLGDGSVMRVSGNNVVISMDDGATWESRPMLQDRETFDTTYGALFRTRAGVIVYAFINMKRLLPKAVMWE